MAPEGWSPRFSATQRAYRYRILNRSSRPALDAGRVWHIPHAMDAEAMDRAAAGLLGQHDFSAYRAASCQAASPVRTMELLRVRREGDEIIIEAEARSFLHHQLRTLAGTLAEVPLSLLQTPWLAGAGHPAPIIDPSHAIRDARARLGQVRAEPGYRAASEIVFRKHGSRSRRLDDDHPARGRAIRMEKAAAAKRQLTLEF
jgi:hypothetical protein